LAELVKFNKGEILFEAGATSREMYIIKTGLLSIYIKKKDQVIELATLGGGEVLGEMAFFDGAPRSASAKALKDTELLVVSFKDMDAQLKKLPAWLQSVIKTILTRIRKLNDKLRALEQTSASASARASKKSVVEPLEVIRICSYILLTIQKWGSEVDAGDLIDLQVLEQNAFKIFDIPQGKFITVLDILEEVGILEKDNKNVTLLDMMLLQGFIKYFEEEQLKTTDERLILSPRDLSALGVLLECHGPEEDSQSNPGMVRSYIEDAVEIAKEKKKMKIHKSMFGGLEELGLIKDKMVYKNNKVGIDYNKKELNQIYPFQKIISKLFE